MNRAVLTLWLLWHAVAIVAFVVAASVCFEEWRDTADSNYLRKGAIAALLALLGAVYAVAVLWMAVRA